MDGAEGARTFRYQNVSLPNISLPERLTPNSFYLKWVVDYNLYQYHTI